MLWKLMPIIIFILTYKLDMYPLDLDLGIQDPLPKCQHPWERETLLLLLSICFVQGKFIQQRPN